MRLLLRNRFRIGELRDECKLGGCGFHGSRGCGLHITLHGDVVLFVIRFDLLVIIRQNAILDRSDRSVIERGKRCLIFEVHLDVMELDDANMTILIRNVSYSIQ